MKHKRFTYTRFPFTGFFIFILLLSSPFLNCYKEAVINPLPSPNSYIHQKIYLSGMVKEEIQRIKDIKEEKDSLIKWLDSVSGSACIPSVVVALIHNDKIIIKKAANTGPGNLFRTASHTKFFTTLAVLQLDDRGLININDPVSKYLPVTIERKEIGSDKITIRHLLSHTSGISPYAGFTVANLDPPLYIPRQLAPAGQHLHYSNEGYNLLGRLISKVTGENLGDYVTENIIRPLEMKNAVADKDTRGASGIKWSLDDMINFLRMFLHQGEFNGKTIIERRWFREMYKINRIGIPLAKHRMLRGICYRILTINDRPFSANHASLWAGSGGWFQIYPTHNAAYIFTSNTPYFGACNGVFYSFYGNLQYKLNHLIGKLSNNDLDPSKFHITGTTPEILKKYSGIYMDIINNKKINISYSGITLYAESQLFKQCSLVPAAENTFRCGKNEWIHFIDEMDGLPAIFYKDNFYIKQ